MSNLVSMAEELAGIRRVGMPEDNGGGGHSGSCFSGKIRPRVAWIDPVSMTVGGHVLWPLPTVMVAVTISNLIVKVKASPSSP